MRTVIDSDNLDVENKLVLLDILTLGDRIDESGKVQPLTDVSAASQSKKQKRRKEMQSTHLINDNT